jgi:ABC-2 type transport system ATP-binding protein
VSEVLAAVDLHKSFGPVKALDGVSFSIEGPRRVGLLGPNGAGKTTLLEILEGLTRPSRGTVRLFGTPLGRRYPKRRVGVVLQRESAIEGMTAAEYAGLFASLYRVEDGAARILEGARLASRAATPVERLSAGEAQRLYLAAACVHEPELLILDEPTAHLDPAAKREIVTQLREGAAERTVLLATHDLREAETACDEVLFLVGGQLRARVTVADLAGTLEEAFFAHCGSRLAESGDLA